MQGNCIKIHKSRGELLRIQLVNINAFDSTRKIEREGDYLYIPVNSSFNQKSIEIESKEYELIQRTSPERLPKIRSYRDLLKDRLPSEIFGILPRAFDTLGQIAVVKISEQLEDYSKDLGQAILSVNKNIKSVFKTGGISGQLRLPDLELIAGNDNSKAVIVEFGIHLELDLRKVYFSPRLATERHRIASMVERGEYILDMFAGVGPFSIMIAKIAEPKIIYAVDLNPEAISFLKKNMKKNKVTNIEPMEGDAKKIVGTIEHYGNFNRIIMNLPHLSYDFFHTALGAVKNQGVIHYYEILDQSMISNRKEDLKELAISNNLELEIIHWRKVHTYSPTEVLTVFDLKIKKND